MKKYFVIFVREPVSPLYGSFLLFLRFQLFFSLDARLLSQKNLQEAQRAPLSRNHLTFQYFSGESFYEIVTHW